jgi:hypothetical protein
VPSPAMPSGDRPSKGGTTSRSIARILASPNQPPKSCCVPSQMAIRARCGETYSPIADRRGLQGPRRQAITALRALHRPACNVLIGRRRYRAGHRRNHASRRGREAMRPRQATWPAHIAPRQRSTFPLTTTLPGRATRCDEAGQTSRVIVIIGPQPPNRVRVRPLSDASSQHEPAQRAGTPANIRSTVCRASTPPPRTPAHPDTHHHKLARPVS